MFEDAVPFNPVGGNADEARPMTNAFVARLLSSAWVANTAYVPSIVLPLVAEVIAFAM